MELSPEDKQRIYQEEKARIEAQEAIRRQQSEQTSRALQQSVAQSAKQTQLGCGIVLGMFVIVGGIMYSSCDRSQAPSTAPPASSGSPLTVGADGRLTMGGGSVIVAQDQKAESDMSAAAAAGDKVGYSQVVEQGRAFQVSDGTKAKLIGYGDGFMGAAVYHVRIQGGPYNERDGWVPMEWMKSP